MGMQVCDFRVASAVDLAILFTLRSHFETLLYCSYTPLIQKEPSTLLKELGDESLPYDLRAGKSKDV